MQERRRDASPEQLLHADSYTPEQLSKLTGVGIDVIRRAAFDGELDATIINKHIVRIPRSDAVRWLAARSIVNVHEP